MGKREPSFLHCFGRAAVFIGLPLLVGVLPAEAQSADQLVPKPKAQEEEDRKQRIEDENRKLLAAMEATENLIKAAEVKRAKLLRNENFNGGFLLVWAIPQPSEEDIPHFLMPLNLCLHDLKEPEVRQQAMTQQKVIPGRYALGDAKLRAVYLLIPAERNGKTSIVGGSYAAGTQEQCLEIAQEEVTSIKMEVGKTYHTRKGPFYIIKEVDSTWRFSHLIQGTGREDTVRKWVGPARK